MKNEHSSSGERGDVQAAEGALLVWYITTTDEPVEVYESWQDKPVLRDYPKPRLHKIIELYRKFGERYG